MRSLLGTIVNRSQVPLSPRRAREGWFNLIRRSNQDERLMRTMSEVGTLFAIVNRITTAVSKVDWHFYQTAASGLKEDRIEVTDPKAHPMISLWARPNPMMNRRRFMEMAEQHRVHRAGLGREGAARSARMSAHHDAGPARSLSGARAGTEHPDGHRLREIQRGVESGVLREQRRAGRHRAGTDNLE